VHDISDAILSHVSNFAVGLALSEEGAGSKVLGSGTLVSIEGRRGILTCGHVAEAYQKQSEIALIRFSAERSQRTKLKLGDSETIIVESSDTWSEKDLDLAFTYLPPEIAASIEAQVGVFLNIEKNKMKVEAAATSKEKHIDAMLGLVAEFSQRPFIEGREIISPMRGVLHTGHIRAQDNGLLTFDAMDYNLKNLPKSFGGISGSGLWRVHFVEDENTSKISTTMLCGVTSWQVDERKIACQGWDRIDQGLIPAVRNNLQF
jgi:hypothetical protein